MDLLLTFWPIILASGNVSSITDYGVGNYEVNFTASLAQGETE
jgi:hypothetical protein